MNTHSSTQSLEKTTPIIIRPQAHGGKFLGDDIGGALITIKDAQTGALLADGVTKGGSGLLDDKHGEDASLTAIVTPSKSPKQSENVQWVHAVPGTSEFHAELPLERVTLLEITAHGPIGGLQSSHRSTVFEWVSPRQDLTSNAGVVVVIPGLLVQVLTPSTHTKIESENVVIELSANVTMMCGCPIEKDGTWPESDFVVTAKIEVVGTTVTQTIPMPYDHTISLFTAPAKLNGFGNYT